jgi:hypothetical protein
MDADDLVFGSHDTTAKVAAFIRSGRVPDDGFSMAGLVDVVLGRGSWAAFAMV